MAGFEMSGFTPKAREITQMAAECAGGRDTHTSAASTCCLQ